MKDIVVAITAASYSGNKGAAAMLQSSIRQLNDRYGERLQINLMSVYPKSDATQLGFDNIEIVSTKPEELLFLAFPMAVCYKALGWIGPVKKLLLKNTILAAYANTDMVLDEAGISFVDSRGFIMNTYAFVCAAVPLLMGVPVVKYSQALGSFENPYNRFLAKWILPKLKFIGARGRITQENLAGIGIQKNVKLCADGAFSMEDSSEWKQQVEVRTEQDDFYQGAVVGVSISSVVRKKCEKQKIDYCRIMTEFVDALNQKGYPVLLIANAARIDSKKPRNNDLMTGDKIYAGIKHKAMVRWYHEEMHAEEIREYIAKCRFLVASRFHAMIGALEKEVPVLLIGWSHKYQEVLEMFQLENYSSDFTKLSTKQLLKDFDEFVKAEDEIRAKLHEHHEEVIESSKENIRCISNILDEIIEKRDAKGGLDYRHPGKYLGSYLQCRKGYASDSQIRENAASGGMVTALLCNMLKNGDIDGAWVTKTAFENGQLTYKTYIATTEAEIRDASSSVYMTIPHMAHLNVLRDFTGKVAVVLTPCMMKAFQAALEKEPKLKEKVVLKIGLYCSGNHDSKATTLSMKKAKVATAQAERLYYRRGHWRGTSSVVYQDGSEQEFSYKKLVCAYKNAYFFEKKSCMSCKDHFAEYADLSVGDIWLKEMKKGAIKHSGCVIRTRKALEIFERACSQGDLVASELSDRDVIRSQKRALNFKFHTAGKQEAWNRRLARFLAEKDRKFSEEHYELLAKVPGIVIYYYMCFIRVLLSF